MLNRQALGEFIKQPVKWEMIVYLAEKANGVLQCVSMDRYGAARYNPDMNYQDFPVLEHFISNLCKQSNVQVSTLMSVLVYIERLRCKLPRVAKGVMCTCHRIFLASLILAAKYLNDSSPKNKHWTKYTNNLFSLSEVNLMEKQLLTLLDWDLSISVEDLYKALAPFLAPIKHAIVAWQAVRSEQCISSSMLYFMYPSNTYTQSSQSPLWIKKLSLANSPIASIASLSSPLTASNLVESPDELFASFPNTQVFSKDSRKQLYNEYLKEYDFDFL